MAFDDKEIRTANEELEKRIIKDRSDWVTKIKLIIADTKDMRNLTDCQIQMLSYRQLLIDKMSEFKSTIYKRNGSWDRYFKSLYRDYSLNYDIKLSSSEKAQFIKADLSALKTQIKLLEGHIEFYQECIRTLDNLAFAIRNRIKLNDDEF